MRTSSEGVFAPVVLLVRQLAVDAVLVVLRGESASGELALEAVGVVGVATGKPLTLWRTVDFADGRLEVGRSRQGEVLRVGTIGEPAPADSEAFLRVPYRFSFPESRLSLDIAESACLTGFTRLYLAVMKLRSKASRTWATALLDTHVAEQLSDCLWAYLSQTPREHSHPAERASPLSFHPLGLQPEGGNLALRRVLCLIWQQAR